MSVLSVFINPIGASGCQSLTSRISCMAYHRCKAVAERIRICGRKCENNLMTLKQTHCHAWITCTGTECPVVRAAPINHNALPANTPPLPPSIPKMNTKLFTISRARWPRLSCICVHVTISVCGWCVVSFYLMRYLGIAGGGGVDGIDV